jgi:hypothetical protein
MSGVRRKRATKSTQQLVRPTAKWVMAAAADVVVLGLAMVADADADSDVDAAGCPALVSRKLGETGGLRGEEGCVCV